MRISNPERAKTSGVRCISTELDHILEAFEKTPSRKSRALWKALRTKNFARDFKKRWYNVIGLHD